MPTSRPGIRGRIARRLGWIPRGTRIDPTPFSEDEFPVHCLECGYALRGLPDGRCPECGEEFTRGRLLVDLYARGRLPRRESWARTIRLLERFAGIGVGAHLLTVFGVLLANWISPDFFAELLFRRGFLTIVIAICYFGTAPAFLVACISLSMLHLRLPPFPKRRAVRKAVLASFTAGQGERNGREVAKGRHSKDR